MRLYNSLSRELETLPESPAHLGLYVCGVTPYDSPHLGHARAAVVFDAFVRYLRSSGRGVTYVRNITDIDDKIIDRGGSGWRELAERCTAEYRDLTEQLGCAAPDGEPKVTDHVTEIIDLIRDLEAKGHAYAAAGSVYFSVRKCPAYGALSNRDPDAMLAGARVEAEEEKADPLDFALWKAAKPGEPSWDSPWGPGRPGWHIECSAMSLKYLGKQFDIHGGGIDLIFPHHENERAQTMCCTGLEPARIWMHNGLITLNKTKMSKSIGNTISPAALIAEHGAGVLRFLILSAHYSSPIDFSDERLVEAKSALDRLATVGEPSESDDDGVVKKFRAALDENFNTPAAFAVLFDAVRDVHAGKRDAGAAAAEIRKCGSVLGLELIPERKEDAEVEALIAAREAARARRDFKASDEIRNRLSSMGVIVEDTAQGTKWRR